MFDLLRARMRQGMRTSSFPNGGADFPERFRGLPILDPNAEARPDHDEPASSAFVAPSRDGRPMLDVGSCLFSPEEAVDCGTAGAVVFTHDHRMASSTREGLISPTGEVELARALDARMLQLFGRSLRLRSVVAGSCGGCEAELTALGNVVFDMSRFGIQFVASPRHADGVVITGAFNRNMRVALEKTIEATPPDRSSSSRWARARFPADRFEAARKSRTASRPESTSTSTCLVALRIHSRCWMGCCGSSTACPRVRRTGRLHEDRLSGRRDQARDQARDRVDHSRPRVRSEGRPRQAGSAGARRHRLLCVRGIGWSDDTFESARIPVSDRSLAGYVVATRGAVIFENLPQSKRFRDAELLLKHGVVSSIGVAVRLNDTAVGVLSVHTRVQQTFTSEQITRVERAGEALAAAGQR